MFVLLRKCFVFLAVYCLMMMMGLEASSKRVALAQRLRFVLSFEKEIHCWTPSSFLNIQRTIIL